jgi:plasmid stabilization system protein ParE
VTTRLEYSPDYERDLDTAIDWLWSRSAALAQRFADSHDRAIAQIWDLPFSGQRHEGHTRSIRISSTDYRIIYRYADDVLTIVELSNSRRG